ncbi:MAG: phosphate signaling complex protein PhoU [Eubacteriales bacterium]
MANRKFYMTELDHLTNEVICMGNALEVMIGKVEVAIRDYDIELAQEVIESDDLIDAMESKIEKECIDLIAKQQPVARDLRRVSSCMRLISDMERIGDHCEDICEYIIEMKKTNEKVESENFYKMFKTMRAMLHKTIKSFAKEQIEVAREAVAMDDIVDALFLEELAKIKEDIAAGKNIDFAINYLLIVKYVERMGDHAANIAEWVHYLVGGELEASMHLESNISVN